MTFFPMHMLGLQGMPRRVYTYPPETGWGALNMIASIGAVFMAAGVLVFLVQRRCPASALAKRRATTRGTQARSNGRPRRRRRTATSCTRRPSPDCEPLWDNPPDQPVVVGLQNDIRDVLVTHVLDATPDHRLEFPEPSIWPFAAAVATTGLFIGSIFTPWAVVYGTVPLFITLTGWFWPKVAGETGTAAWPIVHRTLPKPGEAPRRGSMRPRPAATLDVSQLAPGAFGHRSLLWWGTMGMVLIEGTMFGIVIVAYFYLRMRNSDLACRTCRRQICNGEPSTCSCCWPARFPTSSAKKAGERIDLRAGAPVAGRRAWRSASASTSSVSFEFCHPELLWNTNAYGSIVWMLLGLHTVHIATDVVDTGVLTVLMFVGPIEEKRFVDVAENSMSWLFVVFTWIPVYFVIYIAPRLT